MEDFSARAKGFDTDRRQERARALAAVLYSIIGKAAGKTARKTARKTAMEFGCGTGLVGLALADCMAAEGDAFASLVFVDSAPGMISQLKEKLKQRDDDAFSAVCCDLLAETPENRQVDVIFSSLVLHHIADTAAALARLYDLLTPGGLLLIVDLDSEDGGFHAHEPDFDGHNGFDRPALVQTARRAGFAQARAEHAYWDKKMTNGVELDYALFVLIAQK